MAAIVNEVNYLRKYGHLLLMNGWSFVGVHEGTKRPVGNKWQDNPITAETLDDLIAHAERRGHRHGIGLLTEHFPAVDIDSSSVVMIDHMLNYATALFGPLMVRVGNPPRVVIVFCSELSFGKMQSAVWVDQDGGEHRLEILGKGQQVVAYHVHPGTRAPYEWPNGLEPRNTNAAELVELTRAQAQGFIEAFDAQALSMGWNKKTSTALAAKKRGNIDQDNPFAADEQIIIIDPEKLREALMLIPNSGKDSQDYDTYLQIGMALYHQTNGSSEGLDLFIDWAEQSDKFDHDDAERRYESFDISAKGRAPITARYILKLAQEAAKVKKKRN
jgi:Primase C terminal 2 (PriCT-2)/Bifunctional DNA primase/polymerase, N-terminal